MIIVSSRFLGFHFCHFQGRTQDFIWKETEQNFSKYSENPLLFLVTNILNFANKDDIGPEIVCKFSDIVRIQYDVYAIAVFHCNDL